MDLVTAKHRRRIQRSVVRNARLRHFDRAANHIRSIADELHASIPVTKRASYGIYFVLKTLGQSVYVQLRASGDDALAAATGIYDHGRGRLDYVDSSGVALQVASLWAIADDTDFHRVLPLFEDAATSEQWVLREHAQGLFRKITKAYPDEAKRFLTAAVRSRDDKLRRFASETLRPVSENRWLNANPDYALSILRPLFTESHPYPRTSVGNNLSDLSRRQPELVYRIVAELVASDDPHAFWIAHRACRNLVKSDPTRVMNLLRVDQYEYKKRIYRRGHT